MPRTRLAVIPVALLIAACGGGGGGSAAAPTAATGPTRTVATWWDGDQLRPRASGAVKVDAAGSDLRDGAGQQIRVGEWTWYYDADGSPIQRVERFDETGKSLGWTEYNADSVDPVTRRGSIRDDSSDVQR